MLKKFIVGLVISGIRMLKKMPMFKSIILFTGEVETEHYIAATGQTVIKRFPKTFMSNFPFFNTVNNNLLYYVPKVISTTGNTAWIGANTLTTQAAATGKDGITLDVGGDHYATTTTKDDGGTGSEAYVKFKGVRTAAGSESVTGARLGLDYADVNAGFNTIYATQTVSQSLVASDVYTVNWTLTVS